MISLVTVHPLQCLVESVSVKEGGREGDDPIGSVISKVDEHVIIGTACQDFTRTYVFD